MIQRLERERSHRMVRRWALLIREVIDKCDADELHGVWALRESELALSEVPSLLLGPLPVLREVFSAKFDPVPVNSEQSERLKVAYQRHREMLEDSDEDMTDGLKRVPLLTRVAEGLEQIESGNAEAWWPLNLTLMEEPDGIIRNEFEADLTIFPAWQKADADARERILRGAERYVVTHDPEPERWITESFSYRPDNAGYRALALLMHEKPERLALLSPEHWRRWAPVIVAYRHQSSSDVDLASQQLTERAYRHAPEEVISAVIQMIDAESRRNFVVSDLMRKISLCLDERLGTALLEKVRDPDLTPVIFGELLGMLLESRLQGSRAYAEEVIGSFRLGSGGDRTRAVTSADALIFHEGDAGWDVVWPAIESDIAFGEELLMRVAWKDAHSERIMSKLTEQQLAGLYLWLARQYPHEEDPHPVGVHSVSSRENIGHWRDYVLGNLQRRGTRESVEAIEWIGSALPHLPWLRRVLFEARDVTRRATWDWPSPQHVFALTRNRDLRVVHNADQLMKVIIESLERLEFKLQRAESRAVVDIWNVFSANAVRGIAKAVLTHLRGRLGRGNPELTIEQYWKSFGGAVRPIVRPIEENLLSDYVKRHLDDDLRSRGIVINREVENQRRNITDIRVDAINRDIEDGEPDIVTVIIEVKGCWHPKLDEAMKTQLVDRYLRPANLGQGLYLVGWFNCDQWDVNDPRKREASRRSFAEARLYFEEQAASLTGHRLQVRAFVLDAAL